MVVFDLNSLSFPKGSVRSPTGTFFTKGTVFIFDRYIRKYNGIYIII